MSSANNDTYSPVASSQGQSAGKFAASLVASIVIFAVQVLAFLLIKDRLARIYSPRTYLVPERERTKTIPAGWFTWIKPVLSTSNSEFVQKCGLDAYFFLRYLRMLLKIFVPATLVILPILLPLNTADGKGSSWAIQGIGRDPQPTNVTGLDQLSWGNVKPSHNQRYWAHWILALLLIIYVCYVAFDELKNYIRMRQAYLTSPQHRLRASATTVLVSAIPDKWLSVEALEGLYDVFPGGIRNIWINRNFDELSAKVARRDKLAATLESAETDLVRLCFKKHQKQVLKAEKAAGKTRTKAETKQQAAYLDEKGQQQAHGAGMDTNNPHQVQHTVRDVLDDTSRRNSTSEDQISDNERSDRTGTRSVPLIGDGLHVIGHGFNTLGKGIVGGIRGVNKGVVAKVDTTNGFVAPIASESSGHATHRFHLQATGGLLSTSQPGHDAVERPSHDDNRTADPSPKSFGGFDRTSAHTRTAVPRDNDQDPLTRPESEMRENVGTASPGANGQPLTRLQRIKKTLGFSVQPPQEPVVYPKAYDERFAKDAEDAMWTKYLQVKDRPTMRLPIRGWQWMPALPLLGQKTDTIYYCRKELARLNVEIEEDQAHPERFPFMNSAFVQFNHQVAAHMACQAVSHHLPQQMDPRLVEIDPGDVIWDNMSIPWWQSYIRTGGVVAVVIGMIILWAVPVGFTSALSQLDEAAKRYPWLHWVLDLPDTVQSILQGILPTALLAILMFLLPVILRFLSRVQGMQSGVMVELSVQKYYFFFLFIQIFLVITVAGTAFTTISYFTSIKGISSIPQVLGTNIPRASNYFFSYMLLQALSVSAGALVQVGGLIGWFILAPILDSTARAKFVRQTELSNIQWGTFFPVYTNLACIGLIYAVISPLILVFNIITFSLFWFVYRYQTLFVTRFTLDTGGLLFPNAVNTTFVGLYVMEIALIGLFFLVRNENDDVAGAGRAIGMIVILILTAGYQILLNNAFSPLFRYLPITLEDDAVRRDEEFARAMRIKHGRSGESDDDQQMEDRLEQQGRSSHDQDKSAHEYELQKVRGEQDREFDNQHNPVLNKEEIELQNPEILLDIDRESKSLAFMRKTATKTADVTLHKLPGALNLPHSDHKRGSWADRSGKRRSSAFNSAEQHGPRSPRFADGARMDDGDDGRRQRRKLSPPRQVLAKINNFNPIAGDQKDLEAQQKARQELADALFADVNDELEDLTPGERDALVQRAFRHAALRARRPVIWIPRDELGVSDDEVMRMGKLSDHIWVSNVRQGLDSQGRTVYSGAPLDFSELDLIRL